MALIKFYNKANGQFPFADTPVRFNTVFDEFFNGFRNEMENSQWVPAVNISEGKEEFKIDLSLPGMEKKDVKIEVEENVLHISGEHTEESKEENEKYSRREIRSGSFKRSFTLPDTADGARISANMNNGILNVVIAKKEEAKPAPKREISIS